MGDHMARAVQAVGGKRGRLTEAEGWWARQRILTLTLYCGIHASCLLVLWVGASRADLALFAATFFGRMFFITGGYHRYFAHKTYETSRAFQFVLALMGATAIQKGPLWWAGHHRSHAQRCRLGHEPDDKRPSAAADVAD